MSEEEDLTDSALEPLEVLTTLQKANEPSARKKFAVSFDDTNLVHDTDRHKTHHSQTRWPSFYEQSWHRKDSSTRVKDSKNFISFHNIVYQVPVKKWCREQPPKTILHGIRYTHSIL